MKIYQSNLFRKKVKKFLKKEKEILDTEVRIIVQKPGVGEEKKGDLNGIFVHKFKIKTLQYLLAYRIIDNNLELIMIAPHENYYRTLKSYLRKR
jgi:mRNA interferase RelE/StbE